MKTTSSNNLTVVKHNRLNQASYNLTLDERRLVLSSIAKLDSRAKMPESVTIYASEFAELWGIDERNAYEQLKEARKNLFNRSITIRGEKYGRDTRWIYDAEYADGEGYIKLSFSPTVAPYLSELKSHFTSYRLTEVSNFKSGHAIRLYELLMQYEKTGCFDCNLDELKVLFGVEDKYTLWGDFHRYALKVAVDEINKATNLEVVMNTAKRGRKIHRVMFTFHEKKQQDLFN